MQRGGQIDVCIKSQSRGGAKLLSVKNYVSVKFEAADGEHSDGHASIRTLSALIGPVVEQTQLGGWLSQLGQKSSTGISKPLDWSQVSR